METEAEIRDSRSGAELQSRQQGRCRVPQAQPVQAGAQDAAVSQRLRVLGPGDLHATHLRKRNTAVSTTVRLHSLGVDSNPHAQLLRGG